MHNACIRIAHFKVKRRSPTFELKNKVKQKAKERMCCNTHFRNVLTAAVGFLAYLALWSFIFNKSNFFETNDADKINESSDTRINRVTFDIDKIKYVGNRTYLAFALEFLSLEDGGFNFTYKERQSSTTEVITDYDTSYKFEPNVQATTGDLFPKIRQGHAALSTRLDLVFEQESGNVKVQKREALSKLKVTCEANKRYLFRVVQLDYKIEIPMKYHSNNGKTAQVIWKGHVFSPGRFTQTIKGFGQSREQHGQETGSSQQKKDVLTAEDEGYTPTAKSKDDARTAEDPDERRGTEDKDDAVAAEDKDDTLDAEYNDDRPIQHFIQIQRSLSS